MYSNQHFHCTALTDRVDLLPDDYYEEEFDIDLKSVVISAGWMMLDSYITLSRVTMTASEVMEASSLLQTAQYAMLRLTAYKVVMLNNPLTLSPKEIKPHMCSHIGKNA